MDEDESGEAICLIACLCRFNFLIAEGEYSKEAMKSRLEKFRQKKRLER